MSGDPESSKLRWSYGRRFASRKRKAPWSSSPKGCEYCDAFGTSPLVVEPEVGSGENHDVGVGARTPWEEVVDLEEGDSDYSEDLVLVDKGGAGVAKLMERVLFCDYLTVELSTNEVCELIPMQVALDNNNFVGIGKAMMFYTVSDSGSVSTSVVMDGLQGLTMRSLPHPSVIMSSEQQIT
ncbi:hypothetical protein NE237_001963 [Protea cynaroides]|uniref:Uncharacterized protein n=1 Tax=Protea cynaroides TaxID=273540 RepID=A0A9Q0QYV7_9MAGN|nr:hypothetical protein NE237_001963 [Protea cynaroides]